MPVPGQILELEPGASHAEVGGAWKRLVFQSHPDRCGDGGEERTKILNHARDILMARSDRDISLDRLFQTSMQWERKRLEEVQRVREELERASREEAKRACEEAKRASEEAKRAREHELDEIIRKAQAKREEWEARKKAKRTWQLDMVPDSIIGGYVSAVVNDGGSTIISAAKMFADYIEYAQGKAALKTSSHLMRRVKRISGILSVRKKDGNYWRVVDCGAVREYLTLHKVYDPNASLK